MTVRPLRLLGDPVLRTASDPVVRFDESLAHLVTDLLDTVQVPGRAGLAANQIGSSLAVFAYNLDGQLGYVINPRVTAADGIQDETDHLSGKLYIDRLGRDERRAVMRQLWPVR